MYVYSVYTSVTSAITVPYIHCGPYEACVIFDLDFNMESSMEGQSWLVKC